MVEKMISRYKQTSRLAVLLDFETRCLGMRIKLAGGVL